jgi:hypothetical protein
VATILKKLTRIRQGRSGYVAPIFGDAIDFAHLLGASGHFKCDSCGCPWLHCHHVTRMLHVGCTKCHWGGMGVLPNPLDMVGDITCPKCKIKDMAIIVSHETLCVGCKRCAWELRTSLVIDPTRLMI